MIRRFASKSGDALENVVGGLGPDEGPQRFVAESNMRCDGVAQGLGARWVPRLICLRVSSTNRRSTRFSHEGARRREMQVVARVAQKPALDRRRFVGVVAAIVSVMGLQAFTAMRSRA